MGCPGANTVYGILYEGERRYGVLNGYHLPPQMRDRIERYKRERGVPYSSAPWITDRIEWRIEGDRLYLTQVLGPGVLGEIFGEERIPALWLERMELRRKDRRICRTYETSSSYLHRMETLTLILEEGRIVERREDRRLYTLSEPLYRARRSTPLTTLRIEAEALRSRLRGEEIPKDDDPLWPVMKSLIERIVEGNDPAEGGVTREALIGSLADASTALLGSVRCRDPRRCISELYDALSDGVLRPRALYLCLHYGDEPKEGEIDEVIAHFREVVHRRSSRPDVSPGKEPLLRFSIRIDGRKDKEGSMEIAAIAVI